MRKGTPGILLAAALALSAGNAAAVSYTFTNIADSTGPFSEFNINSNLSLNDSGTVAFPAVTDTGAFGIFAGSGGATTTLYTANAEPFATFRGISLNNRGTLAFTAFLNTDEGGILTGNGGPTRTIVDFGVFDNLVGISHNNRGTVAFSGSNSFGQQAGVFTGSGGPLTTIADSSGEFASFIWVSLNDSGTVAFLGTRDGGRVGIFTSSDGSTTTIADSKGPFGFFGSPSLNDSGTVAFLALLDNGAFGIFTGSGGPTTTIAHSRGPFDDFFNPSLNDSGAVVFSAFALSGETAILTGPDPLADVLIATGDPLFGSTLERALTDTESLNNAGQIAFFYVLADGRQGIARADPLVTPVREPGTLGLLAAGLLGAVLAARRPRRGGLKAPGMSLLTSGREER